MTRWRFIIELDLCRIISGLLVFSPYNLYLAEQFNPSLVIGKKTILILGFVPTKECEASRVPKNMSTTLSSLEALPTKKS